MPVEKQYDGIKNTVFQDAKLETTEWQVTKEKSGLDSIVSDPTDATIRVSSAHGKEYAFHEKLRKSSDGPLLLMFEAKSQGAIQVALSSDFKYVPENMYRINFGESGNTKSRLSVDGAQSITAPGRHCQDKAWTSYWICVVDKKFIAGLGKAPGSSAIAMTEIPEIFASPAFVGFKCKLNGSYHLRNVRLTTCPDFLQDKLKSITPADIIMVPTVAEGDEEAKLLEEYQAEVAKQRARAEKFGIEFKEPNPAAFLNWSEAKKLRSTTVSGFATGINLSDPKEKEKQEARKKRFATQLESLEELEDKEEEPPLPVSQAWDNEDLTKRFRIDPPSGLWLSPRESSEAKDPFTMEIDEPAFVPSKVHIFSMDWAAFKQIRSNDIMAHFSIYGPTYVEWLSDLSCNVHFEDQFSAARAIENLSQPIPSPTLEEISAGNESVPDFGNMGWRMGTKVLRKLSNDRYGRRGTSARLLLRVATNRDILHERPKNHTRPPGFSPTKVLGPGSEKRSMKGKDKLKRKGEREPKGDPMTHGLSSGRPGFSVEELEAERAKKRAKSDT